MINFIEGLKVWAAIPCFESSRARCLLGLSRCVQHWNYVFILFIYHVHYTAQTSQRRKRPHSDSSANSDIECSLSTAIAAQVIRHIERKPPLVNTYSTMPVELRFSRIRRGTQMGCSRGASGRRYLFCLQLLGACGTILCLSRIHLVCLGSEVGDHDSKGSPQGDAGPVPVF